VEDKTPKIIGPFHVGPRKISTTGRGEPIIYLGKEFTWAKGKKAMIQLIIIEE